MAENENQKKVTQTINKAKITKIKEPEYGKELLVDKLIANPGVVERHIAGVRQTFADTWKRAGISDEEINRRVNQYVQNIVLRDNEFNLAMQQIVPCYKFEISTEDLGGLAKMMKMADPNLANVNDDLVKMMAQRMVEKELVFVALSNEWKIQVTDEEADKELEKMYKETNASVSEIVSNPERFENFKQQMREHRIVEAILGKFKFKIDEKSILENARKSREANEAAIKARTEKNIETVKQQIKGEPAKPEEAKK